MPSTYVGTAYTPPDVKWPEVELKWFMPSHTDNVDCWSGFIPLDTSYDRASQKMMLRKNMS